MLEFLGFVLDLILGLCELTHLLDYWRFGLCMLAALAIDYMIDFTLPNRAIGTAFCVLATILGMVVGICWQCRRD